MAASLDPPVRKLLDEVNFCTIATLRKDGSPHLVSAWVSRDEDHVLVNSALGRVWPTNLERDERVSVLVSNADNAYEFAHIRGRCVELTEAGADEHIDFLSKKYMDVDAYPHRLEGERRVLARIEPVAVHHFAGPAPIPVRKVSGD